MAEVFGVAERDHQVLEGRFSIKKKLGSGGMGVVYLAHDRERGVDVALKTLRNYDGASLYRFKKEFRTLAEIVHPNLVTLYELVSSGDEWFFTMELVEGISFLRYVRPHDPPAQEVPRPALVTPAAQRAADPNATESTATGSSGGSHVSQRAALASASLRMDRLRSAGIQLADAVQAIHDADKLHRDIKPSNILVTPEGRVVLCDFGLVADARKEHRTLELHTVGTPAYMSPEQAGGRELSPASDWYSVGVVLYEALTANVPFVGSFEEVLRLKKSIDPPPPHSIDESVPAQLDELCTALLSRDQSRRPAHRAVREALGGAPIAEIEAAARMPASPFVGREQHLDVMRKALADTRGGRSVAVLVHGLSGMGKTALVREFLDEIARDDKAVILEGRCYERESVPYKALDSLVDALSNYLLGLDAEEIAPLMPRDIVPLARLFPVLRRVRAVAEPDVRSFEPPDPQETRRRAFGALRYLLDRLAADRPVVLHIDDLQWGDVDSGAFLGDLIHHPLSPAVLLVLSYRREDVETSPLLQTVLRPAAADSGDVRMLAVDELSELEAREMVASILGKEEARSAKLVPAVLAESGGSPFFLAELTHAALECDDADVVSLKEVLQRRIDGLAADAAALLVSIAVAGRPLPVRVAARAASIDTEAPVLARLRAARLVRTRRAVGRYEVEPYHDRVRETVLARLGPDRLRAAHSRLFRALEQSDKSDLQALVDHCLGAGDSAKAGRYAARAAVQAERALAFDRAAHYFGLALELQELTGSKRRARQKRMASALANAGRLLDAAELYLSAAEGAEPEEVLELRRNAAEQFLHGGMLERGLEITRLVVDEVGLRLPRSQRMALWSVAWRRLWIRVRGLRFRERRQEEIADATLKQLDVCWSTSSGLSFVDPMLGKAYQMRHLLDALASGEPFRISLAFSLEMGYLALAGGKTRDQVERLYRRNLALAERVGHPHAIGMCYAVGGLSSFLSGQWREAVERVLVGEQILRDKCIGVRWELGLAKVYHLSSLLYLGEMDQLTKLVPLLLRDAEERGDQYAANGLRAWHPNMAWLAMDAPDEARKQALAGALKSARDVFHLHHYYELLTHAQIDLYRGAGPDAWQRVSERWRALEGSMLLRIQSVRIQSAFVRARCALAAAAAGTDRDNLLGDACRTARRIEREKMMWGDPMAKLVRAGAAALRGQSELADEMLCAAIAGFDAADMSLLATVARRQRGRLLGGDSGGAMVAAADSWMEERLIKAPARMADMFAPGFAS